MDSFRNREEAGTKLAERLSSLLPESLVLFAVPRGGVPVALPISRKLKVPIELVPIRRIPVPWAPEIEVGYTTDAGELHLNQPLIGQVRLSPHEIYQIAKKERKMLQQELAAWGARPVSNLVAKTALIVDDGLHSGWTMFSAVEVIRKMAAQQITVAAPVSHFRAQRFVKRHCDEMIVLLVENTPLFHIADYYREFPDVSDDQIRSALATDSAASVGRQLDLARA